MSTTAGNLRERQAEQVRRAVLESTIAALETRGDEDLSMADVAEAAGISLRTLYRYFPDRAALLQAAGERLYAELGVEFEVAAPDDIAASFRDASRRLSARPKLVRALVRGRAGQVARAGVRRQRVEAIRAVLEPLAGEIDPDLGQGVAAVITHLCSAAAWVAVADEGGLPDAKAQAAVGWAIAVLVEAMRKDTGGSEGAINPRRRSRDD